MFKCKKILALVLAIVALAVVAVPAWATEGIANGGTGIIQLSDSSSYVNMRNSASTSGAIRARLGHGTTLTVLSSTNGTTVNGPPFGIGCRSLPLPEIPMLLPDRPVMFTRIM